MKIKKGREKKIKPRVNQNCMKRPFNVPMAGLASIKLNPPSLGDNLANIFTQVNRHLQIFCEAKDFVHLRNETK
jgi:hypothetical protein